MGIKGFPRMSAKGKGSFVAPLNRSSKIGDHVNHYDIANSTTYTGIVKEWSSHVASIELPDGTIKFCRVV